MFRATGGGRFGGYRGRGGTFQHLSSARDNPSPTSVEEPPAPAFGEPLTQILRAELEDPKESYSATITNCSYVASYNWLKRERGPVIAVPGAPPKWTPPSDETRLREDSGIFFRDMNAARYARHPMQPAVEAVLASNVDFEPNSIDLVACGSTMGNLLRFARGINEKPFRIIVEVIDETVFFIRRENSPTELIQNVRGYGHTMPEAYTSWNSDIRGSESHQRILKYRFGDLDCLVRFEADGYLGSLVPEDGASRQSATASTNVGADEDADSLLSSTHLGSSATTDLPAASDRRLVVTKAGPPRIPQESIFDLKTRSIKRKDLDFLNDELPRLWLAQIPNWILAFHERGRFLKSNIEVKDVRGDVQRWESDNKDDLHKFACLLHKIIELAKGRTDGRLELCRDADGPLEIREVGGHFNKCLPVEVEERWIAGISPNTGEGVRLR